MTTKKIDCTPSWEGTVNMCITILLNSKEPEGLRVAKDELTRIGRMLDEANAKLEVPND